MRVRWLVLATLVAASAPALADKEKTMQIVVKQSTQASFDGTMVGINRIGQDEAYELADGTTKKGTIARISIQNGPSLTVGVGSAFDVGAHRYEVVAIADGSPRGTVTFKRIR